MVGFTMEVDLKDSIVRTTFRKEVRSFAFNDTSFPLLEAMKVAVEDAHNQIRDLLKGLVEYVENNGLMAGDVVTCDGWDGDTAVIERIDSMPQTGPRPLEPVALFAGGGFWRVSQLTLIERPTKVVSNG